MQKLLDGSNGKGYDACVKEKRHSSWQRRRYYLSLSGSVRRTNNTILLSGILGTTHTSLGVVSVSPFHAVAAISRSALCWNIQDPLLNYKLTLPGLWQNFQKKTNPYGSPKYQMRHLHTWNKLTYFWHLNWGIQPFQCIQKKTPSSTEWLLNPGNKGKYKRKALSLICRYLFFLYIYLGIFFGQGIAPASQRGVK